MFVGFNAIFIFFPTQQTLKIANVLVTYPLETNRYSSSSFFTGIYGYGYSYKYVYGYVYIYTQLKLPFQSQTVVTVTDSEGCRFSYNFNHRKKLHIQLQLHTGIRLQLSHFLHSRIYHSKTAVFDSSPNRAFLQYTVEKGLFRLNFFRPSFPTGGSSRKNSTFSTGSASRKK